MAENIANKDAAFECLDIARAALRAGDHERAEKFAQKALKLYRCQQVQIFISEMTHGRGSTAQNGTHTAAAAAAASGGSSDSRHSHHDQQQHKHQQQQPQNQYQQQHNRHHSNHHQQQQQHNQHARQSHQQQQHQSSSGSQHQQQQPRGMGGSEGLRHRQAQQNRASAAQQQQQQQQRQQQQEEDPSVTPEQRRVVKQILAAKSFYDVLGVPRDASDADIKQAYRKLALRLHPDKNKALHADEAFKLLSKAFSCLSSPDKRAYYDRTGYENSSAQAAAATATRRAGGGGGSSQFYYSGPDDFDPEEIFNMFFGGGPFSPHARVFRSHFGGHPTARAQPRAQHAPSREEQQRGAIMGLLQLLPVLLVVGITLFSGSHEPTYSLMKDGKYLHELQTSRIGANFYVKDVKDFDNSFPPNSHKRLMLERQVETDIYERVYQRCQAERMAQHRAFTWGNRDTARRMELAACKELGRINELMGAYNQQAIRV